MRDLILKMFMSLDGFVGGADGDRNWMINPDPVAKAWAVERAWTSGLHVMGSRTFREMASYWPLSTDDFAAPMNQIPKAVFSSRGPAILDSAREAEKGVAALQPGAETWTQAHVASRGLAEEVAKLKAQAGKPMVAYGGASFARSLIAHDLIDQYDLMIHPLALGRGQPLFADLLQPRRFALVSSKAFPQGSIAQSYRPV